MTVLCGACGAENRDAAKFCKGCGRKIAQAWPQATPLAIGAGAGEATVLLGAAAPMPRAAPPPEPAIEELDPAPAPVRPRIGNGRWIAGLAIGVAVLVLAAAWWGHKNRSQEIAQPAPAQSLEVTTGSPAPAQVPAATVVGDPVPAPAPVVQVEKVDLAPSAESSPAASPAKPRKQVVKKQAPPPPAPVVEAVAPAPPSPPPDPVRLATPQETCAGRNFIARAQCLADQCARPDVASHPQCEAVRRQQRLEEEKRNPTMGGAG